MGLVWDALMCGARTLLSLRLNAAQREYAKWRMSADGRKHYSLKEQHAFWEAFKRGDTAVIDTGIRDRQSRIDRLRREVGLGVILACMAVSGCVRYSIPEGIPAANEQSLTSTERTYVVNDMALKVPGAGERVLPGTWHVISSDMMKLQVRNQDDLVTVLEAFKDSKRELSLWRIACAALASISLLVYFLCKRI